MSNIECSRRFRHWLDAVSNGEATGVFRFDRSCNFDDIEKGFRMHQSKSDDPANNVYLMTQPFVPCNGILCGPDRVPTWVTMKADTFETLQTPKIAVCWPRGNIPGYAWAAPRRAGLLGWLGLYSTKAPFNAHRWAWDRPQ